MKALDEARDRLAMLEARINAARPPKLPASVERIAIMAKADWPLVSVALRIPWGQTGKVRAFLGILNTSSERRVVSVNKAQIFELAAALNVLVSRIAEFEDEIESSFVGWHETESSHMAADNSAEVVGSNR